MFIAVTCGDALLPLRRKFPNFPADCEAGVDVADAADDGGR